MRYGIFSDVHSNLEALEAVLERYASEGIEQYLCAGDVVGYAANPNECVEAVKKISGFTVAGNHDLASVGLYDVAYLNALAAQAVYWTRAHLSVESNFFLESLRLEFTNQHLTLVHGALDNPGNFVYMLDSGVAVSSFARMPTQVCFVGHTHVPGYFVMDRGGAIYYHEDTYLGMKEEERYIVNVGSVGQPRDGNPDAAYCIYDTQKKEIRITRVRYRADLTRKKIITSGLPRHLGDRLLAGR